MKQTLIIISSLLILVSACKKLDQLPEATASEEAVFGSEKGLQLYAASFYNNLPAANDVVRADNMSDYAARTDVPSFLTQSGFSPAQSSGWSWTALRNINYFIEHNNHPNVAPSVRENYTAIARFFRALFYFDKVQRFGNVPWYGNTIEVYDTTNLYKARDPRKLVMDSVLADLDFACEKITAADQTRSLITRYVALAYKSRICLFEGTFRKYHAGTGGLAEGLPYEEWLEEAVDAADKVMTQGGFSLNTAGGSNVSYRQLFINKTPVASEIILSNVCDATLNVLNDANWYWTSATYGSRLSFTRTFVNTYLNIDGTPFTSGANYQTMPFIDEVKNRDKRLQQTIRMGSYARVNGGTQEPAPPVFSYTYTGYQPIKWCLDDVYFDGGTRNDNSISLIRYAEILLNYAEAKAELNSAAFTDADWTKTIGALRTRAGITGGLNIKPTVVDDYLKTNYFPDINDPLILEIRRERGIELAWEGLRFFDLLRWKRGELLTKPWVGFYVPALNTPMDLNGDNKNDVLFYKGTAPSPISGVTFINVSNNLPNGSVNPQRLSNDTYGEITWLHNVTRVWENKKYLYPIPTNDLNVNPNLAPQNPGW